MGEPSAGRLTDALTFVFTDVVGSTRLWAADPEATSRSFVVHDEVVRSTLTEFGGEVFGWAGDSFRAAFASRVDAVTACEQIHLRLARAAWDSGPALQLRIGVTRGQALHRSNEYFGPVLNTASRLEEIAQPGQTVLGAAAVVGLDGVSIMSLGRHRVRDVTGEIELFQLGSLPFPPLRSIDATLSTVPPSPGTLVGRADAVDQVRDALSHRSPVTVVGTGGAGKTRLAIEVAHLERNDYPDGCYFIDLAPVTDAAGVAPAIARCTRITLSGGDPLTEIVDHFANRRALLVFDNCEHLVSVTKRYLQFLNVGAAAVGLLATSREALGLSGEKVVKLGPLPTVEDGGPAVELFVARIRDNTPDFEPSAAQLAQIAEICEHLDGIPLALELAAARSTVLGLDHLLEGMHDRFRMLSSNRSDGTRTLREAIDWSFGLLSASEQAFFVRCGIFNGSFDLRAASAIMPEADPLDVADLLHSLSSKSLIVAEGALGGRFRLLETIRAYALVQLGELDLTTTIRQLHYEHYRDLFGLEDFVLANDLDRAVRLTPEWSNLAVALEWGTSIGEWEGAARLATGCLGLWEDLVPAVEGKRWADRILPNLPQDGLAAGTLMTGLAAFEAQLDNFERVGELLGQLVESPVPQVQAHGYALLGYVRTRGNPDYALGLFDKAEALIAEHDLNPDLFVTAMWTRGANALYKPDLDEAYRCFRQGFDVAVDQPTRTVNSIYVGLSLVTVQLLLARPAEALATLDAHNWSDSRWDSSPILRAVALIDLDRAAEAADLVIAYAVESLRGRLLRMSNDAMVGLAALALHRGETDHAWTLLQQAVTPRTPFTIGLVEGLASRIGRGSELRDLHRNRQVALLELDAIDFVQAELNRLNNAVSDWG